MGYLYKKIPVNLREPQYLRRILLVFATFIQDLVWGLWNMLFLVVSFRPETDNWDHILKQRIF